MRMDSPQDEPAGESPGRPLFLLANDLEIDFPSGNAVELLAGEEVRVWQAARGVGRRPHTPLRICCFYCSCTVFLPCL